MDYKEKYDTALSIAKVWHKNTAVPKECKVIFEQMFPELQEDNEEKIRKAIIAYIDHGQHNGISNKDMIDWLEKQGEKNYRY